MLKKTIVNNYNGNSHNVEFKGGKAGYTAPKILESYVSDDGEVMHVLDNGREQSDTAYCALWAVKKTPVNWKSKGVNPNQRKLL